MKLNKTVVFTLTLLVLMVGAGLASAGYGFALGREALKGITQPDVRNTNNLSERKGLLPRREKVMILSEQEIISAVKARMDGGTGNTAPDANKNSGTGNKSLDAQASKPQAGFPIVSQDQGVTMEIRSVKQQDGFLLINVTLRNDGARSTRFLYSFLSVTDDQGRTINANTDGLPGELSAYSGTFTGTVSVPSALVEKSQKLSMTLTDYPDQKLKLQMSNIPVVR